MILAFLVDGLQAAFEAARGSDSLARDAAPADAPHRPAFAITSATVLAAAVAVLVAGIVPGPLFDLAQTASRSLIGG